MKWGKYKPIAKRQQPQAGLEEEWQSLPPKKNATDEFGTEEEPEERETVQEGEGLWRFAVRPRVC